MNYAPLIGVLTDFETRLIYYAKHGVPENLSPVLLSAATNIETVVGKLRLLDAQEPQTQTAVDVSGI